MAQEGGTNWIGLALLGVGAYFVYEWLTSSATTTTRTTTSTATPGTTVAMTQAQQPTSVSTAPSTTPAPSGTLQTLALNMQQQIGAQTANADQWNYAFGRIMGQGIDQKYNFNFDQVYGAVVNGVRNNGATMSALMFLQLAASAVPGGLPGLSGLGSAIAHFPGRFLSSAGNMIYLAHHPLPYTPTFNLRGFRGLGAFTQASGFEKALWAGRPLRSNRIQ